MRAAQKRSLEVISRNQNTYESLIRSFCRLGLQIYRATGIQLSLLSKEMERRSKRLSHSCKQRRIWTAGARVEDLKVWPAFTRQHWPFFN